MENFPVSQLLSTALSCRSAWQRCGGRHLRRAAVRRGQGLRRLRLRLRRHRHRRGHHPNGAIRKGATGTAGEIGHTIVQYGGRICGCGGRGHLEAYASRTAITRVLRPSSRVGASRCCATSIGAGETAIRSKMIARCIDEGDELVTETLTEAADYLGAGLGSLATLLQPDAHHPRRRPDRRGASHSWCGRRIVRARWRSPSLAARWRSSARPSATIRASSAPPGWPRTAFNDAA